MKFVFLFTFILFTLGVGYASAHSFSEAGYNLKAAIPHDMSVFFRTEGNYNIGLNIYTDGAVGLYSELGYNLCLDPALISYTCDFLVPPANTQVGTDVKVELAEAGVNITFANVTESGQTSVVVSTTGPSPPGGFNLSGDYYDITTTAIYNGNITVCINYNESRVVNETTLRLLHYENSSWVDVTTSLDTNTNIICGTVISLSEFIVAEPIDETPPEAAIRFDIASRDIKVYNSETGDEANYVVLSSKKDKGNKEETDEDDEKTWELRQYTLKDSVDNSLVLVLKHKKEGKEAKIKVLSMQYNSDAIIEAAENKMQTEYADGKDGMLKELEQKIEIKKILYAEAKYNSKKGLTDIKLKIEGQEEQKDTKAGIAILEMLTDKGNLMLRY